LIVGLIADLVLKTGANEMPMALSCKDLDTNRTKVRRRSNIPRMGRINALDQHDPITLNMTPAR
jgi:hypothetical protein